MAAFAIPKPATAFAFDPSSKKTRDWTERLFEGRPGAIQILCASCGRTMFIPPSKQGQRAHCSIECRETSPRPHVEHWGRRIWEKRDGTVERPCEGCARTMHLPPSKSTRRFCTLECRKTHTEQALSKTCNRCGKSYSAWKRGQKYCSQKCNAADGRLSTEENLVAAQAGYKTAIAEGRVTFKSGPENPLWKGGPEALRKRQVASGKVAKWVRRYRKNNPDKVREFTARRKGRKIGRLVYGSIPRIRQAQKNRCAICKASLRNGYHADHIMPLARGGQHVASNIQLLCASCNLAKSSRDPIAHMQSLGRLL